MTRWKIYRSDDRLMTVLIGNYDILCLNDINSSLRIIWWMTMKNSFYWFTIDLRDFNRLYFSHLMKKIYCAWKYIALYLLSLITIMIELLAIILIGNIKNFTTPIYINNIMPFIRVSMIRNWCLPVLAGYWQILIRKVLCRVNIEISLF